MTTSLRLSSRLPLYYGWVLVVALAITETVSFGVLLYSFTIFVKPMQEELGWSSAQITGANGLAWLVSAIVGVWLGRVLDQYGPRLLMTLGSLSAAALVVAWSAVQSVEAFFLVWFLIGVTKAMVLYDPAFWVVADWFVRRRRQALTLLTFIAGFASIIFTPLAQRLLEAQGWRGALLTLALLLALITVPIHALLLRRQPSDLGLQPDGVPLPAGDAPAPPVERSLTRREALRRPVFWWLTIAFGLNDVSVSVVILFLVPYLIDSGYGAAFAALAAGLIGLASLPGRVVFTLSGARWSPGGVAALLFVLQSVSLVVLVFARSETAVLTFVFIFGAGFGAITPTRAALVAEYFGRMEYGAISGMMRLGIIVAGSLAPVIAGSIYDATGTLEIVLWVLAGTSVLSVVSVLLGTRAAAHAD